MMPRSAAPVLNGLSVDVEEYFQVGAFETTIRKQDWDGIASRVEANTGAVLDLFAETGVSATFFTLGWVAHRHPRLIRRIVAAGHEIASHGWDHQRVFTMTPAQFRDDLARTRTALEDAGGQAVTGYRAPSFSIDQRTPWAHKALAEAGYAYSSSVAPVRHDHYGWRDAPRYAFRPLRDNALVELPVTVAQVGGLRLATGGGFFRLLPAAPTDLAVRQVNRERHGAVFYFHPWEGRSRPAARPRCAAEVAVAPLCAARCDGGQAARAGRAARLGPGRRRGRARGGHDRVTITLVDAPIGVREADLADARERARIDAFVSDCGEATPFHLTGWSRAVEQGCGQRARYLVAERADGGIAGVLPLTEMRSLLFGKALVSTGFGVDGGVLGEAVEPLAAGAWDVAAKLELSQRRTPRRARAGRLADR